MFRPRSPRKLLAALPLALVLFALGALPAHADGTDRSKPEGHWMDHQVAEAAENLSHTALHVSEHHPFKEERAKRIEMVRQLQASEHPVYVIALAPDPGEQGSVDDRTDDLEQETAEFVEAVREEMSEPAGHFIVHVGHLVVGVDRTSVTTSAATALVPNRAGLAALTVRNERRICNGRGLQPAEDPFERSVQVALSEDPVAEHEASEGNPYFVGRFCDQSSGDTVSRVLGALFVLPLIALPLLVAAVLFVMYRRARLRRPSARMVIANAGRAFVHDLRKRAAKRLPAIGHTIADARADTTVPASLDALERALDARDAARSLYETGTGGDQGVADAVGIQVLLDLAEYETEKARALAAGDTPPERPRHCYVNPMHGTDTSRYVWSDHGPYKLGAPPVPVPLCGDCERGMEKGEQPEALLVRSGQRAHPYYHLPATECMWSGTGFGAFTEDLVGSVRARARS